MSLIQNHTLHVPVDCRLAVTALWLTSFSLLAVASLDEHVGLAAVWAVVLGLVASTWTIGLLLDHARQVVLQVMSFEHRQQTPSMDGDERTLFDVSR